MRHVGHVGCLVIHLVMQGGWKRWPHRSWCSACMCSKSSRQMVHSSAMPLHAVLDNDLSLNTTRFAHVSPACSSVSTCGEGVEV